MVQRVAEEPVPMDEDKPQKGDTDAMAVDCDAASKRWVAGDRVYAVWAGNGSTYAATVAESGKDNITVTWDDNDGSHRVIPLDQVSEPSEDTAGWSQAKIERRSSVKDTPDKGRCLYTNVGSTPGQVVFVEKPTLVALPTLAPKVWEKLTKIHEAQPLNLGTVQFHFAALCSQLFLDEPAINVILDKYVPEPDEEPGEDVIRILRDLQEELQEFQKVKDEPILPQRLQRLVSAWRYNSFGHHKEDGLVLYNRISMCSHSCDPTCCWSYGDEDAFVLRARIALTKDDELTISYLQDEDLLKGTAVRRQKLQNWRFTCSCPRCNLQVDFGRGFRCRICRVGILYPSDAGRLESCKVCCTKPALEDSTMLLNLEEEYVARVEQLDKTDVADVETVYQAALDIFERHWILYVMDTMLWEAYRAEKLGDAVEHLRRRIEFHEHYYSRPTFILAWCHEEMGDSSQSLYVHRKWQYVQAFHRAYQMLAILCGTNHQYTMSPYNKLWQVSNPEARAPSGTQAAGGGEKMVTL